MPDSKLMSPLDIAALSVDDVYKKLDSSRGSVTYSV